MFFCILLVPYRKTYRKGNFLVNFLDFLGSGAWICQSGAWNCLLGAWNCLLGAWICLWVLGFVFWVLGFVFGCLDLSFGCLDFSFGCLDFFFGCLDFFFGCLDFFFGCLGSQDVTSTPTVFFGPGTGARGFSRPRHRISRQKCRIWMRMCRDMTIFVVLEKLNFQAVIKSAASAASLDLQGSPRTTARQADGRAQRAPLQVQGGCASVRLDHGLKL